MMLRLSFKPEAEATAIEAAARRILATGLRAPDIAAAGGTLVTTQALGAAIEKALLAQSTAGFVVETRSVERRRPARSPAKPDRR